MAEELENGKEQNKDAVQNVAAQPADQNVEQPQTDKVQLRADEVFALLSKPDLSIEEKEKVSALVKEAPEILLQKEFTEKLNMPNLMKEYQAGADINDLVSRSAKASKDIKQVLDNLKEIEIKGKTGAAYLLDNAYLPNGELVGTQLVKNIHFMGTAKKDKDHQFYPDASQNEATRNAMNVHLGQILQFYKTLYENPDGYCANPQRRNISGQKVGGLMEMCQKIEKGEGVGTKKIALQDQKLEDLEKRTFMKQPEPEYVEQKRGEMTVAQLKEGAYRGTLTVAQKEILNKIEEEEKKKEAVMQNRDGNKHGKSEHQKGEPFQEGDVVKYMYEKWFLAGMSWLFDKAEEGLEIMLDKLIDHRRESKLRSEEQARQAKDARQKALLEKVAFFDGQVIKRQEALQSQTKAFENRWFAHAAELKDYFENPTSEKEVAIKAKYPNPEFVDGLKADYKKDPKKVEEFLEKFPKKIKEVVSLPEHIKQLAATQVAVEMMDEVIHSTGAWFEKGTKDFKKDADLMAEYDTRVKERKAQIFEAVSLISEDSRLRAETNWHTLETEEQKEKFARKEVSDVYDEIIKQTSDEKQKAALKEDKKHFEDLYFGKTDEGKALSKEAREEMLFESISRVRVQQFMFEQAGLTSRALEIQTAERNEGHYQAMGHKINQEPKALLEEAKKSRETSIREALRDQEIFIEEDFKGKVDKKRTLLEEAAVANQPIIFEAMKDEMVAKEASILERREKATERKKYFKECKRRLQERSTQDARSAPLRYGGRV
ncbi:MAG TPA: hypothetical protein DIC64_03620 [Alphaproteobacteria bacterium]|nr:hypothetical protein [Alphaproteobacteria bacterium]